MDKQHLISTTLDKSCLPVEDVRTVRSTLRCTEEGEIHYILRLGL
jgi:hypothetical protein